MIRALTVRQPWAGAIAHADKRIENRSWTTPHRGAVLIHSAAKPDQQANQYAPMTAIVRGLQLDLGAVIAVARIVDCHPDDGACTGWSMPGHFHWQLDQVTALPLPVPATGALQLWKPPEKVLETVRLQLDDATAAALATDAEWEGGR
ncbi:ASCH domain-containing protein [Streptomyces diastatochromogenes]|nr:ASCH domain-containing protein [Streptomyces diastatochromogenes]